MSRRLRATYNRYDGVMHMLAALDLATGKIYYRIRQRKRWRAFLGLLKALRKRWAGEKLYIVLDNFSPHRHAEVRTWAADNDIELVFLPTYGSWLNWIESAFAALRYFALNGTGHRTHDEQNAAIAAFIRCRNGRAEPKVRFAPESPIRQRTEYPAKSAGQTTSPCGRQATPECGPGLSGSAGIRPSGAWCRGSRTTPSARPRGWRRTWTGHRPAAS